MTVSTQEQLDRAIQVLRKYGAREIYLFGSFGTEAFDADNSDVDMAVSGLAPEDFFRAMGEVTFIFMRPMDLIDLDEDTLFVEHLRAHNVLRRVA